MDKGQQLAENEGFENLHTLMEAFIIDSVCPGICMNEDCDYTTEVEPDCETGYCEVCETQTVKSGLSIGGII